MVFRFGLTLFHAITAARNGEDLCMMKEPIKQRCGKNLVSSQQMAPLRKAGIGGQNNRAMLIACSNQLKEMPSLFLRQSGVAHLINDQETGHDVAAQALTLQPWIGSTF